MQNKEIMLVYKRAKNLKELLTRANPYNSISNVDDEMHTYVPCKQRCHCKLCKLYGGKK